MCMYGAFTYDYVSRFLFIEYHMTYHMWWKEGSFILYSWEIELCTPCTRPPLLLSGACTETCIESCGCAMANCFSWVDHKDKCYMLSDTSETWSVGEKSCRCWIFSKFDSVALETRVDTWLLLAAVMFMTFSSNCWSIGWVVLVEVEPQVWNPLDSCFLGNFSHFCHLD